MRPRHLVIALALLVALGAVSASGFDVSPQPPDNARLEEEQASSQQAASALTRLIEEGNGAEPQVAEIRFAHSLPPKELISFVVRNGLTVEQLQQTIPGLENTLTGGYVVQPNQTIEEAVERFIAIQEPFFESKLKNIEDELARETDPTRREARERQLADLMTHYREYQRSGLLVSALVVRGTAADLQRLLMNETSVAAIAVR